MSAAILTDTTRCIGCGACAVACKEINGLPGTRFDKLNAYTWCAVKKEGGVSVKRQCMHCVEPACASVCPVAALHKGPTGAVEYDADKCIGCRYCMTACPFKIPKYQWDDPLPKVGKCILCSEKRLKEGQRPACTEICPAGATIFGDRKELLAVARSRLLAEPDRYVQEIYGEKTAGGTSVMYLSGVPFASLGLPADLLDHSYPELTWEILSKIPHVVTVGAVSLTATWWVLERRIRNERRRRAEALRSGTCEITDDSPEEGH